MYDWYMGIEKIHSHNEISKLKSYLKYLALKLNDKISGFKIKC
jgi:hypothetical protein